MTSRRMAGVVAVVALAGLAVAPVRGESTILYANDGIYPDSGVYSPSGQVVLWYQGSGALSLWINGVSVWNTVSAPADDGGIAIMQTDGNFVAYDSSNAPYWHTQTYGNDGAYLAVQDDGRVVLYSATGSELWSKPDTPPDPEPQPAPPGFHEVLFQLVSTNREWWGGRDGGHQEHACMAPDVPFNQCTVPLYGGWPWYAPTTIDGLQLWPNGIHYLGGPGFQVWGQGPIEGPYQLQSGKWEWDEDAEHEQTNRVTTIAVLRFPYIDWAGYPVGLESTVRFQWDELDSIFAGGNDDFDWTTGMFGELIEACLMKPQAAQNPNYWSLVPLAPGNEVTIVEHGGPAHYRVRFDVLCGWR